MRILWLLHVKSSSMSNSAAAKRVKQFEQGVRQKMEDRCRINVEFKELRHKIL